MGPPAKLKLLWVAISKPKIWEARKARMLLCRFGTLLVRKDLPPLAMPSTGEQTVAFWCFQSPTKAPSKIWKNGVKTSLKSRVPTRVPSPSWWLETRAILLLRGRFQRKKPKIGQNRKDFPTLRRQPPLVQMSKRLSRRRLSLGWTRMRAKMTRCQQV